MQEIARLTPKKLWSTAILVGGQAPVLCNGQAKIPGSRSSGSLLAGPESLGSNTAEGTPVRDDLVVSLSLRGCISGNPTGLAELDSFPHFQGDNAGISVSPSSFLSEIRCPTVLILPFRNRFCGEPHL